MAGSAAARTKELENRAEDDGFLDEAGGQAVVAAAFSACCAARWPCPIAPVAL
jgi:hypothetical protein